MPINSVITSHQWFRYAYVRDQGHLEYCRKHDKCEAFFAGEQWDPRDRAAMTAIRRPALTINKIISTLSNVMGEQIYNRTETSYQPRSGANPRTAEILAKVFKNVADMNQLDWKRSDMFADGIIGSRGFLDIRMCFDESMQGDVEITNVNPKNVLIDPDADQYDPDEWGEVFVSKWMTADEIEILYSKEDATYLRGKSESVFPYGYDSVDSMRDRFGKLGGHVNHMYGFEGTDNTSRSIRVIERQWKKLDRQLHFVYPRTGEARAVPQTWDEARVKYVAKEFNLQVIKKLARRIRWTVTADNVVLHDDWSPYKHYTIVPYFPYFRYGNTIGLVENLVDPQELLNKALSQELHIVNTMANSGYKIRAGALANMSVEELEQRGAETGIVIEVTGDPEKDVVKIQPNNIPQGVDRLAYKGEEHIKGISGVPDSAQGMDREDVAGKAIQQKRIASKTNLVKPMDSLVRTDHIIGRNVLDLVQEFMSDERVLTIAKDEVTGEMDEFTVNEIQQATGEVLNDLTIGEYGTVITNVPQRETMEDSEFEQMVTMRMDLGIAIPDEHVIAASRLRKKQELIRTIRGEKTPEQVAKDKELADRAQEAAVAKEEGEASVKHEDAGLRRAKADQLRAETANPDGGTPGLDVHEVEREQDREDVKATHGMQMDEKDMVRKQQKDVMDAQIKAKAQADQAANDRVARMTAAKQPAGKPAPQKTVH